MPFSRSSNQITPTTMTTVATEILRQLGGHQFTVMTGAKNFVALEDGLKFTIGKNHSKANLVKITLTAMDDYVVEFWKKGRDVNIYTKMMKHYDAVQEGRMTKDAFNALFAAEEAKAKAAAEPKLLKSVSGVYCDTLQEVFTEYTWMYTHL